MTPLLTLSAIIRMDRTTASAMMDSQRTVQSVKVQYNLICKMGIPRRLLKIILQPVR